MGKKIRLNDRQVELLSEFSARHDLGMRDFGTPLGLTGIALAGTGQAMSGLLRRGYVVERNRLYYITDAGRDALAAVTTSLLSGKQAENDHEA